MQKTSELDALFALIDDPDEDVFLAVSDKILRMGSVLIPFLENMWESAEDEMLQRRLEMLIHKLNFSNLKEEFWEWNRSAYNDLLNGMLLVAKFQYPDLNSVSVLQKIEKIRRDAWLELNDYLTSLEQAKIMRRILYDFYGLNSTVVSEYDVDSFMIHRILDSGKGNAFSNAILYQALCELLDINARMIAIPGLALIAFFKSRVSRNATGLNFEDEIFFYVDASTGLIYTPNELADYLKKISLLSNTNFFRPMSHRIIIRRFIEEFANCFASGTEQYKQNELLFLCRQL